MQYRRANVAGLNVLFRHPSRSEIRLNILGGITMPTSEVDPTSGNTDANVRELQGQLAGLGAVIDPGELGATSYGHSTMAAVRAFRERHGLPDGDTVDLPTAR